MFPQSILSATAGMKPAKNSIALLTDIFKRAGMSLKDVFPEQLSSAEILYRISLNAGPGKCHCGAILTNSRIGRKYCSYKCRSSDPAYCKEISKIKTRKYSDEKWKEAVEAKKRATTLANYGVEYPMQNTELFLKQQAACFEKNENGLHGYEPIAFPLLTRMYKTVILGTQYMKDNGITIEWLGDDNKIHRSFPDFFVPEENMFVEIKSEYTHKLHRPKLIKCAEALDKMGYAYTVCEVDPAKHMNKFRNTLYNQHHVHHEDDPMLEAICDYFYETIK